MLYLWLKAFHIVGVVSWNRAGNLGDGTLTNRLAPTPVLGDLLFTRLDAGREHVCGIATDGGTYCWGSNQTGKLGDGTETSYLQPRPVRHP